ncbi:peptidase S46 [Capnocytophaga canis]|uniref:Dipeptidyl-peptidase n=1 Tax=Capnocytophaga canis TaxID=1848903 RepID=A0A3A1YPI6_9FLAO|nr:S46 family peptidase [Capnocytophaga canis]RIY38234.1 peptidase S46 [Capnocytophaga canis]
MKKIIVAIVAAFTFVPSVIRADEGMWFLMFIERLNQRDMQKKGLQLTAKEIYDINNNSLKDAIVQFNGGCTASIISPRGLVLTNHHCGYRQIAEVSTPENNYLRDGFWSKSDQDDIKPSSLYVRFFVRMDNVTERMLAVVNDQMSEKDREAALNRETAKIIKENSENGKYVVSVRPFFQGNEYYYFVYQDFKDVRLVGTPEESIGKFGGDTDNWEWPRQTGDFSLFRVYTDKNGNAAEYAADNIPMKSKRHLAVSIKGIKENDFAMILGYPGRTNRWVPSHWVDQNVKYAYPAWVESSKAAMDGMKPFMDADPAVRLMYASKYAQIANYWKNRQGMIEALTLHKTADVKRSYEAKFAKWARKKANRATYGDVLQTIATYFERTNERSADRNYLQTLFRATNFSVLPFELNNQLGKLVEVPHMARITMAASIDERLSAVYDNMHIPAEKAILAKTLKLYAMKGKNLADEVEKINREYRGDFDRFVEEAFSVSVVASKERVQEFMDNPNAERLKNDPLILLSKSLIAKLRESSEELNALEDAYSKAYRKYVDGLRKSGISRIQYPDANSTLRLTYGTVKSLPADPRNADASLNNYTTFKSMVAKYKPNDPEFDMPKRLVEMYDKNDFGRYLDKDGTMHVNFLTDNDITGGNSGSPVMNGKGELIGLAFDGNIEAMAGDVIFDSKLQRTINVDIRYVLWIIDKYAGAKHIVDEMTIVE